MAKSPQSTSPKDASPTGHSVEEMQALSEAHPAAVPFLWLGRKSVEDNFIYVPLAGLIITVLLGLVYPLLHKAPWDFFGSWAIIGFIAYSFVVMSAEPLFRLLARPEDYYGEGQAAEETSHD